MVDWFYVFTEQSRLDREATHIPHCPKKMVSRFETETVLRRKSKEYKSTIFGEKHKYRLGLLQFLILIVWTLKWMFTRKSAESIQLQCPFRSLNKPKGGRTSLLRYWRNLLNYKGCTPHTINRGAQGFWIPAIDAWSVDSITDVDCTDLARNFWRMAPKLDRKRISWQRKLLRDKDFFMSFCACK